MERLQKESLVDGHDMKTEEPFTFKLIVQKQKELLRQRLGVARVLMLW